MKNFLLVVLFILAALGCGVSYLLLRLPQHDVTALIVKYLAVKPGEAPVGESPAVEEKAPVEEKAAVEEKSVETAEVQQPESEAKSEPEKPAVVDPDEGKDWKGLSAENWYYGKKLDQSSFKGKVTLFYVWSSKEKNNADALRRIEKIWSSFKHKPLVVVGSHRGGRNAKIPNACKQLGLTFPMYEGASYFKETAPSVYPYIYIVNHHGKFVYRGTSEPSATEALVNALTACELKQ